MDKNTFLDKLQNIISDEEAHFMVHNVEAGKMIGILVMNCVCNAIRVEGTDLVEIVKQVVQEYEQRQSQENGN